VIWPRRRAALKIRSMYPLSFAVEIDAIVQFREYQGPRSTPGTLTSEPGHCGDLRSPVVPDVHVPCFAGGHYVTRVGVVPARMALAMAREAHAPANEDGSQPCVVYASDEVDM